MPLTKINYNQVKGAPTNVLDYGADSTGATDSTAAIQAAWTAATGTVYYPAGVYKTTGLTHPNKCLKHVGAGCSTAEDGTTGTIIYSTGSTPTIQFTNANSLAYGSSISFMNIYGNGYPSGTASGATSGTNIALFIDVFSGINLQNIFTGFGDIGIKTGNLIGRQWIDVVCYAKTYGVHFIHSAIDTGAGIWENTFERLSASTGSTSVGTGIFIDGTAVTISSTPYVLDCGGNVFNAPDAELCLNGWVVTADCSGIGDGNTINKLWVERCGGLGISDTSGATSGLSENVYYSPYIQPSTGGSFAPGRSLVISNGGLYKQSNYSSPTNTQYAWNIGGVSIPTANKYFFTGPTIYSVANKTQYSTISPVNLAVLAGTESTAVANSDSQVELIIGGGLAYNSATSIATVTIDSAGSADAVCLILEIDVAGAGNGSSPLMYGFTKRVVAWNTANTVSYATIGSDTLSGMTFTITGNATRPLVATIAITNTTGGGAAVDFGARIRAFMGESGFGARGLTIAPLV